MSDKQLRILQHSLGLDQYGRGLPYRNHFVTGEGSDDWPHCQELVTDGLMKWFQGGVLTGLDDCFVVTAAGRSYVDEHSQKPPKDGAP